MMEVILELKTNNALSIVSVDNNDQYAGCINLGKECETIWDLVFYFQSPDNFFHPIY